MDAEHSRQRLRPTVAGSTRTDTVVLLRLDSGANMVHNRRLAILSVCGIFAVKQNEDFFIDMFITGTKVKRL